MPERRWAGPLLWAKLRLLTKLRRAALLALTVTHGLLLASSASAQPPWLGPGDVCAGDKMLGSWNGLRTRLADYGVSFGLQETTEVWGNLAGGIKQGATYDGLTTANLCIDLAKAVHWQNATIYADAYQIWGPGPTRDLVGALQLISSIEANPSTKLYDLWFEQRLFDKKLSIQFGQQGLDDQFMLPPYANLYLNSSFTYAGLAALDLPSGGPSYPLASPFARAIFTPIKGVSLVSGVFTEDPAPPGPGDPQSRDRHGTAFRFDDHTLAITELRYSPIFLKDQGLPGLYELGMWIATGPFADQRRDSRGLSLASPESSGIPLTHASDYDFYAIANQMLWQTGKDPAQGVGVFINVDRAPADRNLVSFFMTAGVNWTGPFPHRPNDVAGLAFTRAGIGAAARQFSRDIVFFTGLGAPLAPSETVIEATYLLQINPWFSLQPDLQYVINPGAGIPTPQAPAPLNNALVIGMRMTVSF